MMCLEEWLRYDAGIEDVNGSFRFFRGAILDI